MFVGLKPKVSAPALSRPVLKRPPKMRRMPSQALLSVRLSLVRPTMSTMTAPTTRPMRMETMEERTVRVPSRPIKSESLPFFMRSHPLR